MQYCKCINTYTNETQLNSLLQDVLFIIWKFKIENRWNLHFNNRSCFSSWPGENMTKPRVWRVNETQWNANFLLFIEIKASLPCSQDLITGQYLSHINPMHTLPPNSFKIYFSITVTSKSGFSKWFFTIILYAFSIPPMHGTCPSISSFLIRWS
jgi:hypothetical protein